MDHDEKELHIDAVLVEVDGDDDAKADTMDVNELTPSSLNENLDALLALRLRGFLKWNRVDE